MEARGALQQAQGRWRLVGVLWGLQGALGGVWGGVLWGVIMVTLRTKTA